MDIFIFLYGAYQALFLMLNVQKAGKYVLLLFT